MLRRIVLLQPHEFLGAAWNARAFAPAGTGLATNIKVKGAYFVEDLPPVPAFRRLATGNETPTAPVGVPRRPAALPTQAYAVVTMFDDQDAVDRFKHDKADEVKGIFADPKIEATPAYCQNGAVGDTSDVARVLGLKPLQSKQLTGKGIRIAIVDTGIDGNHLAPDGTSLGSRINKSRHFPASYTPGSAPRDHGTMCAYDASIAAPKATLFDYALLRSSAGTWQAFLSDAIAAYADLIDLMQKAPGPLVVSNSWGLFDRSDDAPVGSPENYSANANHPFNQIVGALVTTGADVLFAAGNCGADCPDNRCGVNDIGPGASIHGANSHPAVITVAAVTTRGDRLGYSSQGPGDLSEKKPDIAGLSHFRGSGVYAADGGTSAACPVAAGVVAVLRQQFPSVASVQLKGMVQSTADPIGTGWSYDVGYGRITTKAISLAPSTPKQPSKTKKKKKSKATATGAWMLIPTPAAEPVIVRPARTKAKRATPGKKRQSRKTR